MCLVGRPHFLNYNLEVGSCHSDTRLMFTMASLWNLVNVGGVVTYWYRIFQVQIHGLDGLGVIFMHACYLLMCFLCIHFDGHCCVPVSSWSLCWAYSYVDFIIYTYVLLIQISFSDEISAGSQYSYFFHNIVPLLIT